MRAEVVLRFLVELEDDDETAEGFADDLCYTFSNIIDDVEVLDVEEV